MIYLFCNQDYGYLFMQTVIQYAKFHDLELTIIFSEKRSLSQGYSIKAQAKRLVKKIRHKVAIPYPVITSYNINLPKFYNTIKPSSHGIISGFNQIFKTKIIKRFKTLVNFHPSILPLYRGPVPSYWCLHYQEKFTGYTLHKVTSKVDDGEFLFQERLSMEGIKNPKLIDQKIATFAVRTLWQYLDYIIFDKPWQTLTIKADEVYQTSIDYLSFP